jgi:N-methylhydantoinase A
MNVDLWTASSGILRVVNATMADEIRVQAAKKGVDLAGFTLVPFGGAGPVHAAAVAQDLGISRVLVPGNPGAFSAFGLLCADVVHDYVRSDLRDLDGIDPSHVESAYSVLEVRAAAEFESEGLAGETQMFLREVDLRYAGQGYELRVPLEGLQMPLDSTGFAQLAERFHQRHEEVHGHAARGADIEVVSYRLRAVVPMPKLEIGGGGVVGSGEPSGTRKLITARGEEAEATIWRREDLPVGTALSGPVIVEQLDATTVVPGGWSVTRDNHGNLVLDRENG